MIRFMTAFHPKGIHVTPDPSLCNSKQEVSSKTNGKYHPISKGLTLRSDLLGNVQGTAHITCDIVSVTSQAQTLSSTHLSFAISPEIYTASDEVIECRICGLIQQHSAQGSQW
jgi:hypothetical protein